MIITTDQLKALLEYAEMYGVTELKFDKEHFEETLQQFAATPVDLSVILTPPQGRCIDFSTTSRNHRLQALDE